jgi:hypothetical protein
MCLYIFEEAKEIKLAERLTPFISESAVSRPYLRAQRLQDAKRIKLTSVI